MEIKVYPISGTEDLEDLIRLLRQATADRIILFAEGESPSLRDASNLRMLRYYAQERGFELFVITHDPIARREAERLGLYRWDMQDPLGENDDAYQMGLNLLLRRRKTGGTAGGRREKTLSPAVWSTAG